MSQRPFAHSRDLRRLRAEGYTLRLVGGKLVVDDVPFVDPAGAVHDSGMLVMPLTLAGETTREPADHTAYFVGGVPCSASGTPLPVINNTNAADLGDGLVAACYFSAKPVVSGRYADFHEKVTTYVSLISSPAALLHPEMTAKRFRPVAPDRPFRYLDTASSRAGIEALSEKMRSERVAIVGLGGTGAYILDFVAKTPVEVVHLFDGDRFHSHNAFRAPGAASVDELNAEPFKVDYLSAVYSAMRTGVVGHRDVISSENVSLLRGMTFVFVAIDDAVAKKPIIDSLIEFEVPFVDAGMGILEIDGRLTGIVRTTFGAPHKNLHVRNRVSFGDIEGEDDYRTNIQIAELNALNASMAVIRWKKHLGIYADLAGEGHSVFSVSTSHIVNDACSDG
jgi:hypothetical protein